MVIKRAVFSFNDYLEQIQEANAERLAAEPDEKIEISPGEQVLVDRFISGEIKHRELPLSAAMFCTVQSRREQRRDPYTYSRLPDLLELETWLPNDAMLILAGVDPFAAVMEWSYENFMGAQINNPRISHATCFSDIEDLYDYPVASDSEHSTATLKRMIEVAKSEGSTEEDLKALERDIAEAARWEADETSQHKSKMLNLRARMVGLLKKRWDSGDHDAAQRHSPEFFVRWAEKRGFTVEWAEWARKHQLISSEGDIAAPPYFDADSEEYPELLHIAVRAWEHARATTGATPKQRILGYLADRYPDLKEASKEAIAVVANWQKSGGRPRMGG